MLLHKVMSLITTEFKTNCSQPECMVEVMHECWRSIKLFSHYQVSNCGRLRNVSNGRILTGASTTGYRSVGLVSANGLTNFTFHRIVASEFVDNPNLQTHVDHLDLNKADNSGIIGDGLPRARTT